MNVAEFVAKWRKVELKECSATRYLDEGRANWLGDLLKKTRALTALYNKKPTWLADAHRELDSAVFATYGWDAAMPDTEILEKLLALNQERIAICGLHVKMAGNLATPQGGTIEH